MNRNTLPIAISLIVLVIAISSCQSASPDTNRDASKTANANVKEVVNPIAIEAEIIKLENDWAAAAQRHDVEAVRKILADDLVMTYPDGSTGTKAGELQDLESGAITADSWELADTKVTVLSGDAAFITGRGIIKNGKQKIPESKRVIDISGEYRFTDIYAKRNGQWQAVASQTTPIKNPAPAPSPVASLKASVVASPK
jgi:ketosteroid isomerase-like protein